MFLSPSKGERYLFCVAHYQLQVFVTNYRNKVIEFSGAEFWWGDIFAIQAHL
jgi:hypothetical protein